MKLKPDTLERKRQPLTLRSRQVAVEDCFRRLKTWFQGTRAHLPPRRLRDARYSRRNMVRAPYAIPCPDMECGTGCLRACYATPGTDRAYGATSSVRRPRHPGGRSP
eukprot:3403168-Rhodomonas_salina.7